MYTMFLFTWLMLVTYVTHIYSYMPIYAPEKYVIYVKCGEHISFWLNAMHLFINDLKRKETNQVTK